MDLPTTWDDTHFDEMGWHDNRVHGLRIRRGTNGLGELELDLDYILEWLRPTDTTFAFRLAPATLTFLDVFDLRIEIDYAAPGAGITPFSISGIERDIPMDSGSPKWKIDLNWPSGCISFCARGYTQVLRSSPVLSQTQWLDHTERASLGA